MKYMMTDMCSTITSSSGAFRTAMGTALNGSLSEINRMKADFTVAGQNVGQGFVIGIRSKLSSAYSTDQRRPFSRHDGCVYRPYDGWVDLFHFGL